MKKIFAQHIWDPCRRDPSFNATHSDRFVEIIDLHVLALVYGLQKLFIQTKNLFFDKFGPIPLWERMTRQHCYLLINQPGWWWWLMGQLYHSNINERALNEPKQKCLLNYRQVSPLIVLLKTQIYQYSIQWNYRPLDGINKRGLFSIFVWIWISRLDTYAVCNQSTALLWSLLG